MKAFVAAVVGGIGNIRGAMLGGLLIGLVEFFREPPIGGLVQHQQRLQRRLRVCGC